MIAHAIRSLRRDPTLGASILRTFALAIGAAGMLAGLGACSRAGSLAARPQYEVYAVRYGTLERFPVAALSSASRSASSARGSPAGRSRCSSMT